MGLKWQDYSATAERLLSHPSEPSLFVRFTVRAVSLRHALNRAGEAMAKRGIVYRSIEVERVRA